MTTITLPTPEAKAKLMQLAYENGLMQKPVLKVRLDCTEDKVLKYSVIEQSEELHAIQEYSIYPANNGWDIRSFSYPAIHVDAKKVWVRGSDAYSGQEAYVQPFTTNALRDSTAHEIKQALEEFGTAKNVDVTVDLIQREVNEHGFNVLKDGDEYYSPYMDTILGATWEFDLHDYTLASNGLVFLTQSACAKAVANGLFDKIKLKAEIYACYHKWLPKGYVYKAGDAFYAPSTANRNKIVASLWFILITAEFKFPNTISGTTACNSFIAEIGADKLRAYVEGGV